MVSRKTMHNTLPQRILVPFLLFRTILIQSFGVLDCNIRFLDILNLRFDRLMFWKIVLVVLSFFRWTKNE